MLFRKRAHARLTNIRRYIVGNRSLEEVKGICWKYQQNKMKSKEYKFLLLLLLSPLCSCVANTIEKEIES